MVGLNTGEQTHPAGDSCWGQNHKQAPLWSERRCRRSRRRCRWSEPFFWPPLFVVPTAVLKHTTFTQQISSASRAQFLFQFLSLRESLAWLTDAQSASWGGEHLRHSSQLPLLSRPRRVKTPILREQHQVVVPCARDSATVTLNIGRKVAIKRTVFFHYLRQFSQQALAPRAWLARRTVSEVRWGPWRRCCPGTTRDLRHRLSI